MLSAAGLTRWARSPDGLRRELAAVSAPVGRPSGPEMLSWPDPAALVADVATRASRVDGSGAYAKRLVSDAVGDAVAVLATVLPTTGWRDRR